MVRLSDFDAAFCSAAFGYMPMQQAIPGVPSSTGLLIFIGGLLRILMSLVTIYWIKYQELQARTEAAESNSNNNSSNNSSNGGNDDTTVAVKSVIFPIFVRILWLSALLSAISAGIVIFIPLQEAGNNNLSQAMLYATYWSLEHAQLEGVALLLMQKGCGYYSLWRAARAVSAWALIMFAFLLYALFEGGFIAFLLMFLRDALLFIFYAVLWLAPQQRLFRRPALIFYSKCWLLYRVVNIVMSVLQSFAATQMLGACGTIIISFLLFALVQQPILYFTFLQDSRWWQGVPTIDAAAAATAKAATAAAKARAKSATSTATETTSSSQETIKQQQQLQQQQQQVVDLCSPLLFSNGGAEYSLASAQSLAGAVDDLRAAGGVRLLNSAAVAVHTRQPLGAGSFSRVFAGRCNGQHCAIKMIYTMDLTTDVIQRIAAEASILTAVRHRNVVNILGLTVSPPSVCLVLELCSFGSLSDILRGYGFDWRSSQRPPLLLHRCELLLLAAGAAAGLAAVHSYSDSICHRDVKSFNFLVDHEFTVKIADMELGAAGQRSANAITTTASTAVAAAAGCFQSFCQRSSTGHRQYSAVPKSEYDVSVNAAADAIATTASLAGKEAVDVESLLANWLAPEVIQCGYFQQASDVFALGTVLWEILSGELPFDGDKPDVIRAKISSGYQHQIPAAFRGSEVARIVQSCWEWDPMRRPTAAAVAADLEVAFFQSTAAVAAVTSASTAVANVTTTVAFNHAGASAAVSDSYEVTEQHVQELLRFYENNYRRTTAATAFASNRRQQRRQNIQQKYRQRRNHSCCVCCCDSNGCAVPFACYVCSYCCCPLAAEDAAVMASDYRVYSAKQKRQQQQQQQQQQKKQQQSMHRDGSQGNSSSSNVVSEVDTVEEDDVEEESLLQRSYTIHGHAAHFEDADIAPDDDADDDIEANRNISEDSTEADAFNQPIKSTATTATAIAVPRAVTELLQSVLAQSYWRSLESSEEAWAVVTSEPPFVVLQATTAWHRLFHLQRKPLFPTAASIAAGKYSEQQLFSLYSLLNRFTSSSNSNSGSSNVNETQVSNSYIHEWSHSSSSNSCLHTQSARAFFLQLEKCRQRKLKERSGSGSSRIGSSIDQQRSGFAYGTMCFKIPAAVEGTEDSNNSSSVAFQAQQQQRRRISSIASILSSSGFSTASGSGAAAYYHMMCTLQAFAVSNSSVGSEHTTASADAVDVVTDAVAGSTSPLPFFNSSSSTGNGGSSNHRRTTPLFFAVRFNELREDEK